MLIKVISPTVSIFNWTVEENLYATSPPCCFKQKQSLLCLMTCIIQETHGRWAKNHFIKFFVHLNYKKPYLIGAYTIGNTKQGSEEYKIRRGWCNLRDQLKYAQNNKSNPILQKGQRVLKRKKWSALQICYADDIEPKRKREKKLATHMKTLFGFLCFCLYLKYLSLYHIIT